MIPFQHSIQWRIFVYYTALICVAVTVLIGVFRFFEKQARLDLTELELQQEAIRVIPFFFPAAPPRGPTGEGQAGGPGAGLSSNSPDGAQAGPNVGFEGRPTSGRPSGPPGASREGVAGEGQGRPGFSGDELPNRREPGPGGNSGEGSGRQYSPSNASGRPASDYGSLPPRRPAERRNISVEARYEAAKRRMALPHFKHAMAALENEGTYIYSMSPYDILLYQSDNCPVDILSIDSGETKTMGWDFVVTDKDCFVMHKAPAMGGLILGKPYSSVIEDLNDITMKAAAIALLVVLGTSVIGFLIIRYSLKPIKEISETAERIANGNIAEQIDTKKVQSELGQLANVLNRTFGRLGEALKRQIQFTSDASHELRTPVAAILADCQFSLKRERSPERYRETIEVCHESAQHMRSLIEDLRDLADFDEKNDSMVSELVDMKAFISNVVSVMKPLAEEKGLELKSELEDAMVYFDPIRMRQAVLNLLSNAVRYTDSAGEIFVRCVKQANSVVIEVCDTGIGIAPDKVQHIFDRFYRADAARNTNTGGVGLGLAISKSIVEANGGSISVESKLGKGTCFRIRLNSDF